jgi:hypothetical protein
MSGTPDTSWYNDTSTVFNIGTADQLAGLAQLVNTGTLFNDKTINIINDIDLIDYPNWTPIGGGSTHTFQVGQVLGNNKRITNLKIDNTSSGYLGLFGRIIFGIVKNLTVSGTIETESPTISPDIGMISSLLASGASLSNCFAEGSISVLTGGISGNIGGLVGILIHPGTVKNCCSTVDIYRAQENVSNSSPMGGCVGVTTLNTTVENCWYYGSLSYDTSNNLLTSAIGGICGAEGSVRNCAVFSPKMESRDVNTMDGSYWPNAGRVIGVVSIGSSLVESDSLSNNVAFEGLLTANNDTTWIGRGSNHKNGVDISRAQIQSDITIGNRFTEANGWTSTMEIMIDGESTTVPMLGPMPPPLEPPTRNLIRKWIRNGYSGFMETGLLNEWLPDMTYNKGDYVYSSQGNLQHPLKNRNLKIGSVSEDRIVDYIFYESLTDNNIGNKPFGTTAVDTTNWRPVREDRDDAEDGLNSSTITVYMTRGDVTITPRWKCLGESILPPPDPPPIIEPPNIIEWRAEPTSINEFNTPATLIWNVSGTEPITVNLNYQYTAVGGIPIEGAIFPLKHGLTSSGTWEVYPNDQIINYSTTNGTASYVLRAFNAAGDVTSNSITIVAPAPS